MANFSFTRQAVNDINNIWNYTYEHWSEKQADKYYNDLITQCAILSGNPETGQDYSKLIEDLKGFKVNKHIIFYNQSGKNTIVIERILHERMDLKTRLLK